MDGKKVLKGVLGGLEGGLRGAAKGIGAVDINDQNTNRSKELYDLTNQPIDWKKLKEDIKSSNENAGTDSSQSSEAEEAVAGGAVSDVLLKTVYGEDIDDKIIENFAKISAISFEYNDEAKSKYGDDRAVDDSQHIGVIAQELDENPVTEGAVKTNENGDLEVDTRHLTFADTAAIAELSRRVLALEEVVKELKNR